MYGEDTIALQGRCPGMMGPQLFRFLRKKGGGEGRGEEGRGGEGEGEGERERGEGKGERERGREGEREEGEREGEGQRGRRRKGEGGGDRKWCLGLPCWPEMETNLASSSSLPTWAFSLPVQMMDEPVLAQRSQPDPHKPPPI